MLKSEDRPESIVCLEAREICSGASGRNAGHCRPGELNDYNADVDPHRGFVNFAQLHGDDQARKICESESEVLKRLAVRLFPADVSVDEYIKSHDVSCEWTPRRTHDACMTEEFARFSQTALDEIKKAGGDPAVDVKTGKEAASVSQACSVSRSI
jgi:glycine/D-amino acid oxidase-like deaminating enzyme